MSLVKTGKASDPTGSAKPVGSRWWTWIVALAVGCAVGASVQYASPDLFWALVAVLTSAFALSVLRHRLCLSAASPPIILILLLSFVGLVGIWSSGSGGGTSAIRLDPATRSATLAMFGQVVVVLAGSSYLTTCIARMRNPISLGDLNNVVGNNPLLVSAALGPAAVIIASSPISLVERSTYLRGSAGDALVAVVGPAALLGCFAASYCVAARMRHAVVWVGLIALYSTVVFSLGSRLLSLVPLIVAAGFLLSGRVSRPRMLVGTALLVGILLAPVPLALRSLPRQGLQPYVAWVGSVDTENYDLAGSFLNLADGFNASGYAAFVAGPVPDGYLASSLSPLPGESAGWYRISSSLRVNNFVPYGAIGELRNLGAGVFVVVAIAVGIALTALDRGIGELIRSGSVLLGAMVMLLSCLFCVLIPQYNLRSALRMLYLAAAIALAGTLRTHVWGLSLARGSVSEGLGGPGDGPR